MGSVDLKDEIFQPYIVEQKQVKKCYVKFFKRLLNAAVYNASIIYCTRNRIHNLHYRLIRKKPSFSHTSPKSHFLLDLAHHQYCHALLNDRDTF